MSNISPHAGDIVLAAEQFEAWLAEVTGWLPTAQHAHKLPLHPGAPTDSNSQTPLRSAEQAATLLTQPQVMDKDMKVYVRGAVLSDLEMHSASLQTSFKTTNKQNNS